MNLEIDPNRRGLMVEATGIYIRAKEGDKYITVDIAELTWESVQQLINEWGGEKLIKSLLAYY
jgi:hypothetical protein